MYDQYKTALRKLGENCNFQAITPDEILRDSLVFGTILVCGTTLLRVWRRNYYCKLDCKLVDQDDIQPPHLGEKPASA